MPLYGLVAITAMAMSAPSDPVDDWVRAFMLKDHVPGVSLGVYRAGRPIKVAVYGMADLEQGAKVRPESRFEIASITKQFTAVLTLLLAEDGKLSLDDHLNRFYPAAPACWSKIRIREMLTHTSGLSDSIFDADSTAKPWPELLSSFEKRPVEAPPSTAWRYNNTAYYLLGKILEQASGKQLWELMAERIWTPLGMKQTSANTDAVTPNRVRGYRWEGKAYANSTPLYEPLSGGAGGILSTPDDLNLWSEALKHGKLLKPNSRTEMLTMARLTGGDIAWPEFADGYGLGVYIRVRDGKRIEKHSGGWDDSSSQLTRFLDDDLTVVLLTNRGVIDQRPWLGEAIGELFLRRSLLPDNLTQPDPNLARSALLQTAIESLGAQPTDGTFSVGFLRAGNESQRTRLMALGPLRQLQFLEQIAQGQKTLVRYIGRFATEVDLTVEYGADGRISDITVRPVSPASIFPR